MPGRAGRSDINPSSTRAASSGTTSLAATSTAAARFSRRRTFMAASSPPPTTSGGLPAKLTKMGKVRMALASHREPLLRRVGKALWRELDLEPVELLRHDDLAAEPRALIDVEGAVEHLELLAGRGHELVEPLLGDPHMAGGAGAGAAAFGLDGKAPVADHLHHAPAFERLEPMGAAVGHMNGKKHHSGTSCDRLRPARVLETDRLVRIKGARVQQAKARANANHSGRSPIGLHCSNRPLRAPRTNPPAAGPKLVGNVCSRKVFCSKRRKMVPCLTKREKFFLRVPNEAQIV